MKTVTLDVRGPSEALAEFAQVWKTGQGARSDRISFATPELLWKVLTAKRWELLKALCGAGPVTVRDAASRVGRDVKAVYMDLTALVLSYAEHPLISGLAFFIGLQLFPAMPAGQVAIHAALGLAGGVAVITCVALLYLAA